MKRTRTPRRTPLRTTLRAGAAAVAACFITGALANPTDPTVVNGTASFNQAGSVLTVTNSNGAVINWNSFSIAAGETTRFVQPSASSSVLNRVLGGDPSSIYGTLSSNGRVWLVNPAGILVGPGGRIDVAGFVASTLNISNADFLANKLSFNATPGAGNVVNQGEITTPAGGSVYLIGTNVTNEGIITTPQGETLLAAGQTVSLIDTATPGVRVDITGAAGNATNLGTILAEAGRIGIAGIIARNSGTLNASSAVSEGGKIFLRASQDAYVDGNGRIVTTGTTGGRVEVLGERVAVMDNAVIDASGQNGGGDILIGGDYQGKNPNIQNASVTYFGPNATLKADATELGAGGTVIVWADDTTRAYGTISARGGANGGNGGFVETSGKNYLAVDGIHVDTRAPQGTTGNWLLDPDELTILNGTGAGGGYNVSYGGDIFSTTADGATIYGGTIETALASTSVTVQTSGAYGGNGNITATGVSINSAYANSLTLAAYGGGSATGNINLTNSNFHVYGGVKLLAGWDGSGYASGDVISGRGDIGISGSLIQSNGGSVNLWAGHDLTLTGGGATPVFIGSEYGGSTIAVNVGGNINLNGGSGTAGGVLIGGLDDSAGTTSVTLTAGKSIIATGNTGGVWLGVKNLTGVYGSSVTLNAGTNSIYGGNIAMTGPGGIQVKDTINLTAYRSSLGANGNISLGYLSGNTINVTADGAILDGNGSAVNLKADTINLTSVYGGLASGIAISADVDNSDGSVSNLNAYVNSGASYGGISLRVAGDSPAFVDLLDASASQGSIYFSATQDINIDGEQTFEVDNGGDIQLHAGRDVNWTYDADYTLNTTGSAIVAAGRDFHLDNDIWDNGDSLTLIAGRNLDITSSGHISPWDWNNVLLIGGTVNNSGSVNAGTDLDILAGTLNNYGSLSAGNDLTILAGNINGDGSGEGGQFFAGNNITAFVAGDIMLSNGAHFRAGNDIDLTLTGAGSTLSLANGAYLLADYVTQQALTIFVDFTARSSGGIFVNGAETTTNSGSTGFFVTNLSTPALLGEGLIVTYSQPANQQILAILDSNLEHSGETEEERQRRLHDSEANEDGEHHDPANKPVAQCS